MAISQRKIAAALAVFLLLLALGLPAWAAPAEPAMPQVRVEFEEQTVLAEVPLTPLQRLRGLGERDSLEPGRGMLFYFSPGAPQDMCMRAMRFSLDFIWLDQGRVSQITAQVPPDGAKVTVRPQRPAQMVLEVPGGWAKSNGVRPGQKVSLSAAQGVLPRDLRALLGAERP